MGDLGAEEEAEGGEVKPPLKTGKEALAALNRDKLGAVYYSSKGVMVATAQGAGTFTLKEWSAGGGYDNSQKETHAGTEV